jgi:hypothetical protein
MRLSLVLFALVAPLLILPSANANGGISITSTIISNVINASIGANIRPIVIPGIINPFPNGIPRESQNPGTIVGRGVAPPGISFGILPPITGFAGIPSFVSNLNFSYQYQGEYPDIPIEFRNNIPRDIPELGNNPFLARSLANLGGNYIGTLLSINASVNQFLSYLLGPNITFTSSSAGTLNISFAFPQSPTPGNTNPLLPNGFQSLRANQSILHGYTITVTPINNIISGRFITGPLDGFSQIFTRGSIGVLKYINNTYSRIPSESVIILPTGQISFPFTSSGSYFILNLNLIPPSHPPGNSPFHLAASSGQSISIQLPSQSSNGPIPPPLFNITNIHADAGLLYAGLSTRAVELVSIIKRSGLILASDIFNLTHSAGGDKVRSATLTFDITTSLNASVNAGSLAWFKFNESSRLWVRQGGQLNGTILSWTSINGFSQWTVAASSGESTNTKNVSNQINPSVLVAFATLMFASFCARFF